ncbi:hypothetical protein [Amorphus orientalis]|uniref:Uncharacterized protein n=1 Tax=Amorphus orientalis TaxID=649198 RepID=A0AAE4ATR0_9HYPH|nr:hypothetical protein [Amorphus orientalis]MDQ0317546.1 hypothetical protein [Amorphus orientalis]
MSTPLRTSIIVTTAGLLGLVLMFAGLTRTLERGENNVTEARLHFILADLDGTIERNLGLGLPLSELQPIERVLERTVSANESILAIEVFSPTGVALYSTDRGAVGERIPEAWRTAINERASSGPFRVIDRNTLVMGTSVENDFGQVAGWVALILEDSVLAQPGGRLPDVLRRTWPYIIGGLVFFVGFGLAVGAAVRAHIHKIVVSVEAESEEPATRSALSLALPPLVREVHVAGRTIDTSLSALRKIDDEI